MINKIIIENFKSIQKVAIELAPINVLIGANGAGKSNFIGFFRLLKNMYEQNLQTYVAEEAGADNILYFGRKESNFLAGRVEFDRTNAYSFKLKPNQEDSLFFEDESAWFRAAGYKSFIGEQLATNNKESKLKEDFSRIAYYVKKYIEKFKIFHFHDTSKTAAIKRKSNLNDNLSLREDAGNLAAYLYLLQEKFPKDFKKIELVVRAVAPYFEGFHLQPDRLNEDFIRLEWKEKGSDKYFNATHLSDGTLRFMALATLLLQPNAPQVIIIDEPELGLHPFAINKLASLIKKASAQTQIILSTQSINLVDNFSAEDIITVDRKDKQSVFQRQSSENLKEWLDEYSLSDLWNKNIIGARP